MPARTMGQFHDAAAAAQWEALTARLRRCGGGLVRSGGAALVDDLVQETLTRLLAKHAGPPPYPVARTTLVRLYLDHERGVRRRAARAVRWAAGRSGFVVDATHDEARTQRIRRALDSLPPIERAALTLRVIDDLSYEHIGEALGCTAHAARAALHAARVRLRLRLSSEDGRSGA